MKEEACWMLVRALANRRLVDIPALDREHEFDDWFHQNVIGT
jgi:hypothetical protein